MKAATVFQSTAPGFSAFQSTPPVKAATPPVPDFGGFRPISIHAAREGGDVYRYIIIISRRTISIHAAREGGDALTAFAKLMDDYFNPRRP